MELSDFEQEVVTGIFENTIKNTKTLIEYCIDCEITDKKNLNSYGEDIDDVYLTQNYYETIRKINAFYKLLRKLEAHDLISIITDVTQPIVAIGYLKMDNSFDLIGPLEKVLHQNRDLIVLPSEELQFFVQHGFMTRNEVRQEENKADEIKRQNKNYILSRNIGVLAIMTSIGSMVFNYFTYKNDRQVEITKTVPSKVEIVNPEIKQAFQNVQPVKQNTKSDTIQVSKK